MSNNYSDDETFYRRVRSNPNMFKDGRPTSALFKDSKGVSVDVKNGRILTEVFLDEERLHEESLQGNERAIESPELFRLKAIVSLDMKLCKEKEVCVIPDEQPGNPYHALIQRSEDVIELTKPQARALARGAKIEKLYEIQE
jgi:hypothetical protein